MLNSPRWFVRSASQRQRCGGDNYGIVGIREVFGKLWQPSDAAPILGGQKCMSFSYNATIVKKKRSPQYRQGQNPV